MKPQWLNTNSGLEKLVCYGTTAALHIGRMIAQAKSGDPGSDHHKLCTRPTLLVLLLLLAAHQTI